jgi:hypothetical protein
MQLLYMHTAAVTVLVLHETCSSDVLLKLAQPGCLEFQQTFYATQGDYTPVT